MGKNSNSNIKLMGILYLVIGWGRLLRHMTKNSMPKSQEEARRRVPTLGSLTEKIKDLKIREIKEHNLRELSVHFWNLRGKL